MGQAISNVLPECSMHNGIIPMQEPDRLEIQAPRASVTTFFVADTRRSTCLYVKIAPPEAIQAANRSARASDAVLTGVAP